MRTRINGTRNRNRRKGAAAVEFALLGTVFVVLLGIAMDYSRLFYASIEVANAAKAGAQYGAQDTTHASDFTGMQNAAKNDAANVTNLTATASQFCTCPDNGSTTCGTGGCSGKRTYVKVVTNATFSTLGTYLMLPSSTPISATVEMR